MRSLEGGAREGPVRGVHGSLAPGEEVPPLHPPYHTALSSGDLQFVLRVLTRAICAHSEGWWPLQGLLRVVGAPILTLPPRTRRAWFAGAGGRGCPQPTFLEDSAHVGAIVLALEPLVW